MTLQEFLEKYMVQRPKSAEYWLPSEVGINALADGYLVNTDPNLVEHSSELASLLNSVISLSDMLTPAKELVGLYFWGEEEWIADASEADNYILYLYVSDFSFSWQSNDEDYIVADNDGEAVYVYHIPSAKWEKI